MEQQPGAEVPPELCLRVGETVLRCGFDNTLINLFDNAMLNHVQWEDSTVRFAIYNDALLEKLHELGFPQYSRSDDPEWAVQRLIASASSGLQDAEMEW